MCAFHYKYIERKYNGCAKLLFADTDILVYEIEADDIFWKFLWN